MALLSRKMPHVAILLSSAYGEHTRLLRGILHFTQLNAPWLLDVRTGRTGEPEEFSPLRWNYDGVIANRMSPSLAALVRRHHTPTILLNDIWPEGDPLGRINCDNATIARMAADYLAECGFTNFAFVGEQSGLVWSAEREMAFAAELAKRGFTCHTYDGKSAPTKAMADWRGMDDMQRLQDWLMRLSKPAAVFAAYDIRARQILDACRAAGLAVPDDIAILGVDNDEVLCETASPPLSSIAMSTEDAGFRAAELLAKAIRRKVRRGTTDILYTGTHVVARRSTARIFRTDELVRRCFELVEANAGRRFTVKDIVKALRVSRRTLEIRFRAATGHSLNDEITNLRLQRAKTLLAKTSRSQSEIAAECGFCDASHMNAVFHRRCGALPSAFRS